MAATVSLPGRWYSTREGFKDWLGIDSTITAKDRRIDAKIAAASQRIEKFCRRRFIPWTGTKEIDYQQVAQIILPDDLISVTTLSKDGTTIPSTDYFLYPLNAADDNRPYLWLELNFSVTLFDYQDTRQSAITLAGKWGYSDLLRDSGETLVGSMGVSDGQFTSSTTSALEIGMTILMDLEQMFVKNVSGTTVVVTRGVNGTTAATHSSGAAIKEVMPHSDIREACNIYVARLLMRGDTAWSDRAGSAESGFTYFKDMPAEVRDILDDYRRVVTVPPRPMGARSGIGRYGVPRAGNSGEI